MKQRRILKGVLIIVIFSLLPIWQVAANQTEINPELIVDGDEMIIDTQSNYIEFIGNVVAKYLDYQIQGDKLFFKEETSFVKIEGNVKLATDSMNATAQTMELQLEEELLTMTGDVEVYKDGKMIRGDLVTYDLNSGIMRVKKAHLEISGDQ